MEEVQSAKVPEESAVSEVSKNGAVVNEVRAEGTPRHRRPGGSSRYGHRRSPTTGHRVRRHKTPEPNFVSTPERDDQQRREPGKRSLSSPREGDRRRISSSEEEVEERQPRRVSKTKANESTKTKLEASKRWSGMTLSPHEVTSEGTSKSVPPKPAVRTRSKSRGRDEKDDKNEGEKSSWWKSWPSWTQRIRGKSLEREPGGEAPLVVPPRRNRSLERPPVIKEKERKAAAKQEKPPIAKKRSKSKTRTVSDEERRASIEESSDEFWKSNNGLRKRPVKNKEDLQRTENIPDEQLQVEDDSSKQLVLVETSVVLEEITSTVEEVKEEIKTERKETFSFKETYLEIRSEWRSFINSNSKEVMRLRILRNHCIASFAILVMYCGTGAIVFRFTEGAFESFYKCGVKRVKRDFVDGLWVSSHNLREEEWKSLARRKLMEFEEQLHTAYEAGMTSYSGLKAWSFLNAFMYCLTVVTTIGYGHISPSTTTGRVITIVYAIFGIPMFLILLADFGKLFTRGIKFIWAFVRRVYYTGSCKKVRRTVQVQEMMKGVQMVYDIATFRRPSQLPPGVMLDEAAPPPLPPRVYTPGEPPGTPALSTYAIDDEFNLPISVAIFILLIYIICGATVFYIWESWGFFESFYFVFISMSTIGFGDFVPQNQMYMMASIVYLVFGLALTSMCINVVQEKLSDSFRQASAKIGATIGLRVAEEDGAVTPVAPAPVELPQVHGGAPPRTRSSPSTPPTTSAAGAS